MALDKLQEKKLINIDNWSKNIQVIKDLPNNLKIEI